MNNENLELTCRRKMVELVGKNLKEKKENGRSRAT